MHRSTYTPGVPMVKGLGLWFPPASGALRRGRSTGTFFPFASYRAPHPRPLNQFRTPRSPAAVGLTAPVAILCVFTLPATPVKRSPSGRSALTSAPGEHVSWVPGLLVPFCRLLEAVEPSGYLPGSLSWLLAFHASSHNHWWVNPEESFSTIWIWTLTNNYLELFFRLN